MSGTGIDNPHLALVDERRTQARRRQDRTLVWRGLLNLLNRRPGRRAAAQALAAAPRAGADVAAAEAAVRRVGAREGQAVCDRATRALDRRARRVERTVSRLLIVRAEAIRTLEGPVRDPRLGWRPPVAVHEEVGELEGAVLAQTLRGGAGRHRGLPWLVRCAPAAIALVDLVVLFWFTATVFNVDPAAPVSLSGLAALLFAVLGCGISFAWLTLTGLRLKAYRDDRGEVVWAALGAGTWALLALSAALVGALATLMAVRVHEEVLGALGRQAATTAFVVAGVFAVLSVVANAAVVAVHASHGSEETERLGELGRLLRRRDRRLRRLDRRRVRLEQRARRLARRAQRARTAGEIRTASAGLAWAQVVEVARAGPDRPGTALHPVDGDQQRPGTAAPGVATRVPGAGKTLGLEGVDLRGLDLAARHATVPMRPEELDGSGPPPLTAVAG